MPGNVSPGDYVDVEVVILVPRVGGRYVSHFLFSNSLHFGYVFGDRLFVDIVVGEEESDWDVVSAASNASTTTNATASATAGAGSTTVAVDESQQALVEDIEEDEEDEEGRGEEEERQQQQQVAIAAAYEHWERELLVLSEMGFNDLSVTVPVLQTHLPAPAAMGAADREAALQRVVFNLLGQSINMRR